MVGSRRWLLAAAAIGGAALSILACSVIVETRSQQCTEDSDCARFPNAACDLETHTCNDKQEIYCEEHDCSCARDASVSITNNCTDAERHCYDNSTLPAPRPLPTTSPGTGGADTKECPSGGGGSGTGGGATGGGGALQVCEDLPNPVYTIGPDSIKPLLVWVAKYYAEEHLGTLVYQDESSCIAIDKAYGGVHSDDRNGQYMETNQPMYTNYYQSDGSAPVCVIHDKTILPDIYLSDVFVETCDYKPGGTYQVHDSAGPVQAFGFVVPSSSPADAISYEAAVDVYGFGDDSKVSPWDEQKYIYDRDPESGTQAMIAALLGIGKADMRATETVSSGQEADLVGCSPEPEKTIGILATDLVQQHVADIKLLAYQHEKQTCGYFPDSTRDGNDKANVRDGHYFIWGPIHMLQRGGKHKAAADNLINFVSGIVPPPSNDPDDLFRHWADAHLVPQCAMRVRRDVEAGPLIDYHPAHPCSCRYELAATGSTSCKPCDSSCHTCNDGYCEPE